MPNNSNIHDLTYLSLFSSFLGCLNYMENLKQTSNDQLMEELKHQNKEYIEKITKQNDLIIKLLTEEKE